MDDVDGGVDKIIQRSIRGLDWSSIVSYKPGEATRQT